MNKIIAKSLTAFIGCALLIGGAAFYYQPPSSLAATSGDFETRCGWLDNPTPNNFWLYDRDGEWTISTQGGYYIEEDWEFPVFKPKQWVYTNTGSYGYGCACFQMQTDRKTRHVLKIRSSRGLPLSKCRRDKSLKAME